MGNTRICAATPAHAAAIGTLQGVIFPAPWAPGAIAKLLGGAPGFGHLAIADGAAIADGEETPLGFVLCRAAGGEAEILSLGVGVEARGQGVGGRLLEAAAEGAQRRGAQALYLEVSVTNLDALALYRRHGFVEVGARARYYRAEESPKGARARDAHILCRTF